MTSIRDVFRMPTPMKITGRSSGITAAFVTAIIPWVEPTDDEICEALNMLEMVPEKIECAYCGDPYSEWEHLRPLVLDQKPTGFITEIRNLVPACAKCNQSKGNKCWHDWIRGDAPKSPKTRGVIDLESRIARLARYEQWGNLSPLDFSAFVAEEEWAQHWENWKTLLQLMKDAQNHAARLKATIEKRISDSSSLSF